MAQYVDELQFKGAGNKNWSVRFNGLVCLIAENGKWEKDFLVQKDILFSFDPFDVTLTEKDLVDWVAEPVEENDETLFRVKDQETDPDYGESVATNKDLTYYDWTGDKWSAHLADE